MPTQAERRESTQRAIVAAAFDAFAERGAPDVALEEIAQAAGVTKGTIHYHFKNRAGLLAAVAIRLVTEIEDRVSAAALQAGRDVGADDWVRALLVEQATPAGRVLFTTGDELLRLDHLADADPHRYLRGRLERLGVANATVTAAAMMQFGRQLAFGLTDPGEIDNIIVALDL